MHSIEDNKQQKNVCGSGHHTEKQQNMPRTQQQKKNNQKGNTSVSTDRNRIHNNWENSMHGHNFDYE